MTELKQALLGDQDSWRDATLTAVRECERLRAVLGKMIEAVDAVIITGARIHSDPGTHELSLAVLCGLMAEMAEAEEAKEAETR